MGFFDSLKRLGGNILSGIRNVGGSILGGAQKVRDTIRNITQQARKNPLVDSLLKTKIPLVGQSLDDLGNIADSAIDTSTDLGRRLGIQSDRDRLRSPD